MEQPLLLLTVRFETELKPEETPRFRGAVASRVEENAFRNHGRYAYPLVQYKPLDGRAALVFVGEAVEARHAYFAQDGWDELTLGKRRVSLRIDRIEEQRYRPEQSRELRFRYRLSQWAPFRSGGDEACRAYRETLYHAERIALLERRLGGNVLSFLKGAGIWLQLLPGEEKARVDCRFLSIDGPAEGVPQRFKPNAPPAPTFDLSFATNVRLPLHIGLGNHVRVGCGTVESLSD